MQLRTAELTIDGQQRRVGIFASERAARQHLADHFDDPEEAWHELFEEPAAPPPGSREQAYAQYARAIEQALRFGASYPLHLHARYRAPGGSRPHAAEVFVSLEGVRVCVWGGAVRTAMRHGGRRARGRFARFISALVHALYQAGRASYEDTKGGGQAGSELERLCTPRSWNLSHWTLPRYRQVRAAQQGESSA